jgi:hypothetical protein
MSQANGVANYKSKRNTKTADTHVEAVHVQIIEWPNEESWFGWGDGMGWRYLYLSIRTHALSWRLILSQGLTSFGRCRLQDGRRRWLPDGNTPYILLCPAGNTVHVYRVLGTLFFERRSDRGTKTYMSSS